ncbi:MAG: hypothetical protein Fur0039_15710 [Rhodocyclaceae bacterium]
MRSGGPGRACAGPSFVRAVGAVFDDNAVVWREARRVREHPDAAGVSESADAEVTFVLHADRQPAMRLSEQHRREILRVVHEICGPQARVRLFGSRLDDRRRSGDVDLRVAEAAGRLRQRSSP